MNVVDLGAAPGGWTQVIQHIIGKTGHTIALDLLPIAPIDNVTVIQGDFTEEATYANLQRVVENQKIDWVISDMAPNICGVASADQARAMHLAELAMEFALEHLEAEGSFLVKVFQGVGFEDFYKLMRGRFTKVVTRKPKASRGRSSELYLLGTGKL